MTRGPGSREPDPVLAARRPDALHNRRTTPQPAARRTRPGAPALGSITQRSDPRRLHADTSGIDRRSRFSRARIRCTPPVPAVLGRSEAMCGPGVSDMRSEVALQVQGLSAHGVPRFASPVPRSLTRRAAQSHGRSPRSDNGRTGGGRSLAERSVIVWPGRQAAGGHDARGRGRDFECVVTAARAVGQARPHSPLFHAEIDREWHVATASLPVAEAMAGGVQPRGRDGVELRCLVCGGLFMALRIDRRTCSPACARRDRAARAAARLQRLGRPCEACGRVFMAGRADKRFCSSRCRLRAHRRRRMKPTDGSTEATCRLAG
jgi:predicted nucleic acid-binding Zn ribbon protein